MISRFVRRGRPTGASNLSNPASHFSLHLQRSGKKVSVSRNDGFLVDADCRRGRLTHHCEGKDNCAQPGQEQRGERGCSDRVIGEEESNKSSTLHCARCRRHHRGSS